MKYAVSGFHPKSAHLEIDKGRFDEIKKAKAVCILSLDIEEKLALVMENFHEFEVEMLKLAEASLIWRNRDFGNSMVERLALDRRFANLLSACRLYLDQTEHGISRVFGNSSAILGSVKKFKNGLYDENFGYRLMEALRNHVQHAGLPVHIIQYHWYRSPGKDEDQFGYNVIPIIEVETLAVNESFKAAVFEEIRSKGTRCDLRRPMREYITCLIALHGHIRTLTDERVGRQRELYQTAVSQFSQYKGEAVHFPTLIVQDENTVTKEEVALVVEFLGYSDSLRKRNEFNSSLPLSFASNSDQELR